MLCLGGGGYTYTNPSMSMPGAVPGFTAPPQPPAGVSSFQKALCVSDIFTHT